MSSSGAKAALHGYRRQALYTLARIVRGRPDLVFQPEGSEDLAIYRPDGTLVEAVQVKSYAEPLVLSDFGPRKEGSFFRRAVDLASRPGVAVRVASFGPVGQELRRAWAGAGQHRDEVTRKLLGAGLRADAPARLYDHVEWEEVREEHLIGVVFKFLRDSPAGGEPRNAFDLLVSWIYVAAEQQQRITYGTLIQKINDVGRYLAERATHHQEWFTTIQPLLDELPNNTDRAMLAEEFYRGISARYLDIVAGNDVERPGKLSEIHNAYESGARSVIVHGASGQGKSTLAYRYLHDFVPDAWRFSVQVVESRAHALQVAAALSGHLRTINAPMYVYVDVTPRDLDWPELVRALVQHENVRVLVTIREEDFARLGPAGAELRFPHTIPLTLDRDEARGIYTRLVARHPTDHFVTFDDAWLQFGGEGPLLEFVHLLTQSESLRDRLASQVRRLKGEVREGKMAPQELRFLHLVSVANAYEARVDVIGLAAELQLADPALTLELLEREYLLRRSADGHYAEGLHPIRSAVLAEELSDPTFHPWAATAVRVLAHLPEDDLEPFLLYSFSRHSTDVEVLVQRVAALPLSTWRGVGGVVRALIWLGVREYAMENEALIREVAGRVGEGWWMTLNFDIARATEEPGQLMAGLTGMLDERAMEQVKAYVARQTDTARAFARLIVWASDVGPAAPHAPENAADWAGLAEAYFWAAHLGIDSGLRRWAHNVDLAPAVHSAPLGVLADVVLALSYGAPEDFKAQVESHREHFMGRYQRETDTLYVEDLGDTLRSHFIVPFEMLNGTESTTRQAGESNPFHAAAIRRIDLLRRLAPGYARYGSQGYGHHLGVIALPMDETNQPGVEVRSLPPRWLPRTNATFRLVADWVRRPATWRDHAHAVMDLRQSALGSLKELRGYLLGYMRGQGIPHPWKKLDPKAWDRTKTRVQRAPKLPQSAVDEWGFSAEPVGGTRSDEFMEPQRSNPERARRAGGGDAHAPYLNALRDYTRGLQNFFDQATSVLTVNSPVGRAATPDQAKRQRQLAARLGVRTDLSFMSTNNLSEALKHLTDFQLQFRKHVGHLVNDQALFRMETEERNLLPQVWRLWHQFATAPEQRLRDPQGHADAALRDTLAGLRQELVKGFDHLRTDGFAASILSESMEHDGRPALWVRYDVQDPLEIYPGFQRVLAVVQEVLGSVRYQTLEFFAADFAWPTVLIVPLVTGQNLEGAMWRFKALLFFQNGEVTADQWWNFVPVALPDGFEYATGIGILRHPRADTIRRLQEVIGVLSIRAAHIADLARLKQDLTGAGEQLAQAYVASQAEQLSVEMQQGINLLVAAFEDRPDDDELATRPYLQEAVVTLREVKDALVPYDHGDTTTWQIQIGDMPEWVERLQGSLLRLEIARLLRTADALQDSV
jgi:hypothetical protein